MGQCPLRVPERTQPSPIDAVETKFESTGLLCKMSVTISEGSKTIRPDLGSAATVMTGVIV
jgi:hypothetical protein